LPWRERTEVHERRLEFVRGAKRAVVRLVDRPSPVRVREQRAGFVERVRVRILERGRQRQRSGPALLAAAMDAPLEGAEADARAVELEPFTQPGERDEIVIELGVLPSAGDRFWAASLRSAKSAESEKSCKSRYALKGNSANSGKGLDGKEGVAGSGPQRAPQQKPRGRGFGFALLRHAHVGIHRAPP
jgi:hypothetical protein